MIGPKFEAMAGEFTDCVLKKVDVDANSEAAQAAGIQCMPTFKFYKGGQEITAAKIEGANEAKIRENIQANKWSCWPVDFESRVDRIFLQTNFHAHTFFDQALIPKFIS